VQGLHLVPVAKVSDSFHARVLAARLGSEGIVTQFRGNVEGPYPMGAIEVLVDASELAAATEILLADEVESAFVDADDDPADDYGARPGWGRWALVAAFLILVVLPLSALLR